MKQQKFFVGDKVKRCKYIELLPSFSERTFVVTSAEWCAEDDDYFYIGLDGGDTEWDADYFTIVERAWQENTGDYSANNLPFDEGTIVWVKRINGSVESAEVQMFNWTKDIDDIYIVQWRIADEYENPEAFFEQEQSAEAKPPAGATLGKELAAVDTDKFWCETCEGGGTFDETLGGENFSNRYAKCPDCEGKGYWEKKKMMADVQKKNKYTREIKPNVFVDVYDVLRAFDVTDPCLSHLCKKALCAGLRGHKDRLTDLQDIKASIERAIEMHKEWEK